MLFQNAYILPKQHKIMKKKNYFTTSTLPVTFNVVFVVIVKFLVIVGQFVKTVLIGDEAQAQSTTVHSRPKPH